MRSEVSILVVDGELIMRSLLEKILRREGFEVHSVQDGSTALEYLKQRPVNIVVTDMKMSPMDGLELVSCVKKQHPDIGVIIMTAYGDTYTVKDALLMGADEYITKPFKSYEISLVVERAYWRLLSAANKVSP
ncbi:MAG: response regulator [bacterium]